MNDVIEALERLQRLREIGAISDSEFSTEKTKIFEADKQISDNEIYEMPFEETEGDSANYPKKSIVIGIILVIAITILGYFIYASRLKGAAEQKYVELAKQGYTMCGDAIFENGIFSCTEIGQVSSEAGIYSTKFRSTLHGVEIVRTTNDGVLETLPECEKIENLTGPNVSAENLFTQHLYNVIALDLVPFTLQNIDQNPLSICESIEFFEDGPVSDTYTFKVTSFVSRSLSSDGKIHDTEEAGQIVLGQNPEIFQIREAFSPEIWDNIHINMRIHLFDHVSRDLKSDQNPIKKYYPWANAGAFLLGSERNLSETIEECVPGILASQNSDAIEKLYVREFSGFDDVSRETDAAVWSGIGLCVYGNMTN